MARLTWTIDAARALEEIRDYIARDKPGAAKKVARGICDRIKQLKKFPRMGYRRQFEKDEEVREILYGHYRIIYSIENDRDIKVIDIFHSSMYDEESDID